jgi:hypothetical protein
VTAGAGTPDGEPGGFCPQAAISATRPAATDPRSRPRHLLVKGTILSRDATGRILLRYRDSRDG